MSDPERQQSLPAGSSKIIAKSAKEKTKIQNQHNRGTPSNNSTGN